MKNRWIIYGLIGGLVALLVVLGAQLPRDLRALSTADTDNTRWTVFQVDTEFANLSAVLAETAVAVQPNGDLVRLRTEIALSRVNLILQGKGRAIFGDTAQTKQQLETVSKFADAAAQIVDQPGDLSRSDIVTLKELTTNVRPTLRQLVLVGLSSEAALADTQRSEFASKLRRFGLVAIALVTWLAITLLYLDRLLAKTQRTDKEIQATAGRLSATVAASLDGIVIANEQGEVIDFNEAATTIFGWERSEIIGRKMDETIVPHAHRDAHATGMNRYLATHEPRVIGAGRIELSALRKTGEEFPIELNITSAKNEDGELFIAYVRDISERKADEKKLIDARELAERTDRAKSNFLTVMSHEMRTPLNGILGVLDLLKTTNLDTQQERYVQVAAASGEILLEHVNEALDITRIETGVMSLTPEVFGLKASVYRVADVLRTLANEKGLTLDVEFDPAMDRTFFADNVRLNQLLTNLIGNAIKFTQTGGITVKVQGIHLPKTTDATISVVDTGPGIPESRLEDIFEDFVALAQPTGRQRRGDGLGLSISRKVARLMDGELTVQSTEGKGSTFTLNVPLPRAEATQKSDLAVRQIPDAKVRNILIVEDNAINRSVLKEMLIGFGHEVAETENGLEGYQRAQAQAFDLIIMDISMPLMDGIEATRRIREGNGPNKNTFILGLTAHGRQEFRNKAEAAGMDGFCTKPVRLSDLRATLDGIEPAPEPQVTNNDAFSKEVLGDLVKALGVEKLEETTKHYFAELEAGIDSLRELDPQKHSSGISDILHKLQGATVVLGMDSVAKRIEQASHANKAKDSKAFLSAINAIEQAKTSLSVTISRWISSQKA